DFTAARELDSDKSLARHREFVTAYQAVNQRARAAVHLGPQIKAAKGKAGAAGLLSFRGHLLGCSGQWKAALADYIEASRHDPADHWNWYCRATLRLYTGDAEGYLEDCQEMQRRFGQTSNPLIAERLAKILLLQPTT